MSERTYQVIIGVLVLVVLVGGWMMIAGKRGSAVKSSSTATSSESMKDVDDTGVMSDEESSDFQPASPAVASKAASGESVKVMDQSAGMSVMVKSVSLKSRGWVAVEDGKEWIMGAARLEAGSHEDIAVELLRGTVKGETYKAVLFVDDGDGAFDLHKDTVIKNSDGSALSAAFIAK